MAYFDTGAFVSDKWNDARTLAQDSVALARDAMAAIGSVTEHKIEAAGLVLEGFHFSAPLGPAEISFALPDQPPLPDLDLTPGEIVTFAGPQAIEETFPAPLPDFAGSAPALALPGFRDLSVPADFSGTFTAPAGITFAPITAPADFTVDYTVPTPPSIGAVADPGPFTGAMPTPTAKTAPSGIGMSPPGQAPTVAIPVYPAAPALSFPAVPAEVSIPLPTLRTPDLSRIDAVLAALLANRPIAPTTTLPADVFLNTFHQLRGTLGAELAPTVPVEAVLTWMLAGHSIGVPDAVARQLRDRAFAAEDRQAFQAESLAHTEWLARGFSLPGGALEAKLAAVRQQARDKKAELNRDLWADEAKLEIEALRAAIGMGIAYQGQWWDVKTKLWGICSELANRMLDTQIKVLEATFAVYKAKVEAWQAEAEVVKNYIQGLVQAELAKLETTKTEAEIAKLFAQINEQHASLYKVKLDGLLALVTVYKAQIDAANGQLQAEALKLDAFAKQVQAYQAAVGAFEAEWRGYAAAVGADTALVEGFKAQVQAYGAQVDAYGKRVDADRTRVSSQISVGQFGLDAYKTRAQVYTANVEAFGKKVGAEAARVTAEVEIAKLPLAAHTAQTAAYASRTEAFKAQVGAEAARVTAEVEIAKLDLEGYKTGAQVYTAQADAYGKRVEAARSEMSGKIEIEKLGLETFHEKLEGYKAELHRVSVDAEAKSKIHDAQVRLFGSLVGAEEARVNAELKKADQRLQQSQFEASLALKQADLDQTKAVELAKLAMQGESEVARVAAQLAGAALTSVNAQASVQSSGSDASHWNYNYDMTK